MKTRIHTQKLLKILITLLAILGIIITADWLIEAIKAERKANKISMISPISTKKEVQSKFNACDLKTVVCPEEKGWK